MTPEPERPDAEGVLATPTADERAASADEADAGAQGDAVSTYITHPRQVKIILGSLMMTMLLAALDQTIVSTALPTITSDLGPERTVVGGHRLPADLHRLHPLWGKLSDQYGRKLTLQTSVAIFVIGSALAGLSQNMAQLIGFRALQASAAVASWC